MPRPPYELADCPACGATSATTVADGDAIREEVEALWQFHLARLAPGTPPGRLTDRVAFSQPPALAIVRCDGCGLLYRNPRERAVDALYAGEATARETLAALFETQRPAFRAQLERLGAVVGRRGRVLEVGSHVGGFLAAAAEDGWQAEGIDVNAAAVGFARGMGLRASVATLDDFDGAPGFDAIALWSCFDQLPDPRAAAHRARALAGPGGVLVVRVPNGDFWAAMRGHLAGPAAPAARALLAHNNLLAFPYRHGFTTGALARLLDATGWSVVRTVGDTLVPIADEWTRGWAAWEERLAKGALRLLGRATPARAPWLEVYARAA